MGILFNPWRIFVNPPDKMQLNEKNRVPFGSITGGDTFLNTSVECYFDENYIKYALNHNPELEKLLKDNKIPINLNMKELFDLEHNHCSNTAELCSKIYKNLPPALKSYVNLKDLKDGAMLHDIGKVLIPPEILNKHGKFTGEEYKIMHLHSEIGYQILKSSGVNNEVLNLVRYHHDNLEQNKNFVPDVNLQILNLADIYSALTEARVYKDAMNPQQALAIIWREVKNGNIHPMLYHALVKSVTPENNSDKFMLKIS